MISFPASSWQSSRTRNKRPSNTNDADLSHGRAVSTINPRLYLTDFYSARAEGTLQRLGVTHIVSAIEPDMRKDFGDGVTVMHVPIRDDVNTDIAQWFDRVVKFIQDALDADEKHRVLVHCLQGISRSATLVCAYLVATTPMRATEAIAFVQAKRGIVSPNPGFRRQLILWERQFEDARARAVQERRRKSRSIGGFGDALSRLWAGNTNKSARQSMKR